MSESPNTVECSSCPPLDGTIAPNLPTAAAGCSVTIALCQETETNAPTSQGDLEKIAAGIEAQAEAEIETRQPLIEENTTPTSPNIAERPPTAPPSLRADVPPPSYTAGWAVKRRLQRHNWHRLPICAGPSIFHWPSELSLIQILLVINLVLLLGTIASCILLLIWAIDEEDLPLKRLRFALFFCETGYIYFYGLECWRLGDRYTNFGKHIECRHCIGMTQPHATLHAVA